jgi:hypothetical protein
VDGAIPHAITLLAISLPAAPSTFLDMLAIDEGGLAESRRTLVRCAQCKSQHQRGRAVSMTLTSWISAPRQ